MYTYKTVDGYAYVFVDSPVKDIVILETFPDKQVPEDLTKIRVVGLVIKPEGSGVVEVDSELVGESTAENLSGSGHFLLHNTIILLLFGSSLQSLPRE